MTSRQIRIVSLLIFIAGIPSLVGATVTPIPIFPAWVSQLWPFIFAMAGIADKALHIWFDQALTEAGVKVPINPCAPSPQSITPPPSK